MSTREHAVLLCQHCGEEADHRLAYAGRHLADPRQRVATKPLRMFRRSQTSEILDEVRLLWGTTAAATAEKRVRTPVTE